MIIDKIPPQPTITSDRFDLRPVRRSDAGLIELYCADERVARMTRIIPHPLPPGATDAFVKMAMTPDTDEQVWVIDGSQRDHAEVMGLITLEAMDRQQSEIGYWVAPAFWNTGIASEAVRTLIAANPQNARQIYAEVFQDNPGSARVLTNCGFDYLGDAEAFSVAREATVPTWTYVLKMDR
ncbi:GNAT family N-acetyltransferase [Octadecabacter sp. R77987]|uniref:GNAT family N-acetyltransferase n=1 Tax=Octadecabacter sp. R77987 TaxID=3093874 RepID=UPI0036711C5D